MSETLVEMAKRVCGKRYLCDPCPLVKVCRENNVCVIHTLAHSGNADEQLQALQDWAAANPPKTYKDVLLGRFSKALIGDDGKPSVCRAALFGQNSKCDFSNGECCDCWNEPYKEDGENE